LTYPQEQCGPSISYASSDSSDTCSTGGGGSGNDIVDPGEKLSLPITLRNDGTSVVTGIHATLQSLTPGVVILADSSAYPDLGPGASAAGATPYQLRLDPSLACGSSVDLQVTAVGNEGSWIDTFSLPVGFVGSTTATINSTDVPKAI